MGRGLLLTSNLPQLQNLIKRDPAAYKDEFLQQWQHYSSIRQIFLAHPEEEAGQFREIVAFISQVATCYPTETAQFPSEISSLLLDNYPSLSPDTRKALVQNLVLLRNKGVLSSIDLLKSLFPLLPKTTSSSLRASIRHTILTDIKTANQKSKNHKLNRAVQAMLFNMVERGLDGEVEGNKGKARTGSNDANVHRGEEAMWAVLLTKELWKKGIWNDAKSVSIIATGCFHPAIKVQSASVHFFLGSDDGPEEEEADDEIANPKSLQHRREINKKTRSGEKKLERQLKSIKKKKQAKASAVTPNFPALQLLHDPQTFGEKLHHVLAQYSRRFSLDHRVLIIQLLSRVMGAHKTCVLSFYSYMTPYLMHKQLRIPSLLSALAQSVHELTPPDVLLPVIQKIASEFVHPGVGSEVVAAGINAIREISRRQPWAMEEDLLSDLVEYRKSRDKTVIAAARGLLQLYREVNPSMLHRRERGKAAAMGLSTGKQPLPFGHAPDAAMDIDGLNLLEDHLHARANDEEDEETNDALAWAAWEIESDSSDESDDESEGWINVDSDDNEPLELSDSDTDDSETKEVPAPQKISHLATTKILTPADFALLNELRLKAATSEVAAGGGSNAKRKLADLEAAKKAAHTGEHLDNVFVSENDILGPRKKSKATYEERMASVHEGREGREKFGSNKGRKKETGGSSTNKEKLKNKPIMMIMGSQRIRGKRKASLRDKQNRLRKHVDGQKRRQK